MSLGLDLTNATEQGTPIPDGTYAVMVNKAEVADTKTGGQMIKVQLKVLDGQPQAGRVIFDQFNIKNANPQAVQIGLGQLKGMMKCFGHPNPNRLESTQELMGLRGQVTVKTESDAQYGPQSRVKGYKPLTMNADATAAGAPVAPAAPAAQGANPF